MAKYLVSIILFVANLSIGCDQNQAVFLVFCDNSFVKISTGGATLPKLTYGCFEKYAYKLKNRRGAWGYQVNPFILVYNDNQSGIINQKMFYESLSHKYEYSFMKMVIMNQRMANRVLMKTGAQWSVFDIFIKYEDDDWCGDNWQKEYFDVLNKYVVTNERLDVKLQYKGPLYFALSQYFRDKEVAYSFVQESQISGCSEDAYC